MNIPAASINTFLDDRAGKIGEEECSRIGR